MTYQDPTYNGDKTYSIECTGNVCKGDKVRFERAVFDGSYRRPLFSHFEKITGEVVTDSYGRDKQQHTFTIKLTRATAKRLGQPTLRIKGRNLYRNGCWRKPWDDESLRLDVLAEKYTRGNAARQARDRRKADQELSLGGAW